jgi:hypothetical protein
MALPSSGPLSINDIAGEFGGSTPHAMSEYYAGGGLVPAGTSGTYGAVPSSGALSIQNFYGTSNFVPIYIEEVFSTYLYTGNSSTQTITNGINLSANGGLIWLKERSNTGNNPSHFLFDTARGGGYSLSTNNASAQVGVFSPGITFNTNGFTSGAHPQWNTSGSTYVSWTFREQPKFFDVVTYTGNGAAGRTISHNLGSVPGCIIVKSTSTTWSWMVYHRGLGTTGGYPDILRLDQTNAAISGSDTVWSAAPTSTQFSIGVSSTVNESGQTYIAYLFAHNAGGFGATGTDNVITCGTFTTDGSGNATVNLGYEPQWVLWKSSSNSSSWNIADNMRGFTASGPGGLILNPNNANAEGNSSGQGINSTGFSLIGSNANWTWIYVAIRRGPMKTPTTGTSVFSPNNTVFSSSPRGTVITTGFPVDMQLYYDTINASYRVAVDRLRGANSTTGGGVILVPPAQDAETSLSAAQAWDNTSFQIPNAASNTSTIYWSFRRAPGFFDVVCYTGAGGTLTVNHNLGAVPQLMIMKRRDAPGNWSCYSATTGVNQVIELNGAFGAQAASYWGTGPTSTTFQVASNVNTGNTFVAYLFATVAGVSKVGSYTGTGALQTINCGFTGGARFVLIKRTDDNSSGTANWYVYDSARGISSGNDPYLFMNSTAAEVTGTNFVDTTSVGFQVTAAAPAALNANGGTFIFLAIA